MQCRLGNQVPNTFHDPHSRSDLFGQFSNKAIPIEFVVNYRTQ